MSSDTQAIDARPRSRLALWLAGVAFVVWVALLCLNVWLSRSFIPLNPVQLQNSDVIVVGRITAPGQLAVLQVLSGPKLPETVAISNPLLASQRELILPLQGSEALGFEVTAGRLPNPQRRAVAPVMAAHVDPLVYPATPDMKKRVEQFLTRQTDGPPDRSLPRLSPTDE